MCPRCHNQMPLCDECAHQATLYPESRPRYITPRCGAILLAGRAAITLTAVATLA
jgi:ribosomal protein S27E